MNPVGVALQTARVVRIEMVVGRMELGEAEATAETRKWVQHELE